MYDLRIYLRCDKAGSRISLIVKSPILNIKAPPVIECMKSTLQQKELYFNTYFSTREPSSADFRSFRTRILHCCSKVAL